MVFIERRSKQDGEAYYKRLLALKAGFEEYLKHKLDQNSPGIRKA